MVNQHFLEKPGPKIEIRHSGTVGRGSNRAEGTDGDKRHRRDTPGANVVQQLLDERQKLRVAIWPFANKNGVGHARRSTQKFEPALMVVAVPTA